MGLFDFLKHTGSPGKEDVKKTVEDQLKQNNPGIKNLKVDYKKSTVYLSGEAESAQALQSAVLVAGNTQGVESVNVDGMKVPAHLSNPRDVESYQNVQFYIVRSGDSLSKIAQHFYGDPQKYHQLFEANRGVISNPDRIFPGQKIRVPSEQELSNFGQFKKTA